jgi:alpha-acetolactate decarboxylase
VLDELMIKGLHVETMRRAGLHPEHEPHAVFQASTIGALLDGGYEGDVSFAQLAEHGDLGVGTLNHLDIHFSSAARDRGGHVLDCTLREGRARLDLSADLHVELPAGVDLAAPDLSETTSAALAAVERQG